MVQNIELFSQIKSSVRRSVFQLLPALFWNSKAPFLKVRCEHCRGSGRQTFPALDHIVLQKYVREKTTFQIVIPLLQSG
jgi:hypothetical protein